MERLAQLINTFVPDALLSLPPENIGNRQVSWYLQGLEKRSIGKKWDKVTLEELEQFLSKTTGFESQFNYETPIELWVNLEMTIKINII